MTSTGAVVIDTKNPGWGQPIIDAVKTITDKPVTRIINTHTHADHVSGNVEFPASVDVVAHDNARVGMEDGARHRYASDSRYAEYLQNTRRQGICRSAPSKID